MGRNLLLFGAAAHAGADVHYHECPRCHTFPACTESCAIEPDAGLTPGGCPKGAAVVCQTCKDASSKRLLFAIDYDGTWAAAPSLFFAIVEAIREAGHQAILVTSREPVGPLAEEVRAEVPIPIVFAGSAWKRTAAECAGYKVDIWVDDQPETVARVLLLGGP